MRISFKFIIDEAIVPKDYGRLLLILILLSIGTIVLTVVSVIGDFLWARFGFSGIERDPSVLYSIASKSFQWSFLPETSTGDILNCFFVRYYHYKKIVLLLLYQQVF